MSTRTALTALALAIPLALTACGGAEAPQVAATPAASVPEQAPPAAPDVADAGATVHAFGQTAAYPDSAIPYEVTLSQPRPFTPSESAGGSPGAGGALTFDVTVTNKGTSPLDVTLIWPTASSGGAEAEGIYDTEKGINAPPATPVLPGKSITYASAFGVADAADLTVRVPGAGYDDPEALFSLTDATP